MKKGVLGAAQLEGGGGGLRCWSNSKKGGLRCGSGQKRGVFTAAHTYTEHICEYPPPPPRGLYPGYPGLYQLLNCHFLICFTLLGYNFLILLSPKAFVNCLLAFVHCYCHVNHWLFTGK